MFVSEENTYIRTCSIALQKTLAVIMSSILAFFLIGTPESAALANGQGEGGWDSRYSELKCVSPSGIEYEIHSGYYSHGGQGMIRSHYGTTGIIGELYPMPVRVSSSSPRNWPSDAENFLGSFFEADAPDGYETGQIIDTFLDYPDESMDSVPLVCFVEFSSGETAIYETYISSFQYLVSGFWSNGPVKFGIALEESVDTSQLDLSRSNISFKGTSIYTGERRFPEMQVTLNGRALIKDIDFSAEYSNNINAGSATVIIMGKGSFTGTKIVTFRIDPAPIKDAKLFNIVSKVRTGKAIKQVLMVKLGNLTLKNGRDFTVSYKNNRKLGNAFVVVKGKGNFSGVKSATFKIVKYKQPMMAKAVKKKQIVKASALKKKSLTLANLITVKKAKGKLVFANVSVDKAAQAFKVNSKTGKVIIPKGTIKGMHTMKIKVIASGAGQYAYGAKVFSFKMKIK